jgi:hypothetical protein
LGCAAILLRISTILRFQKVIHSEGMYFTDSIRVHISACPDFRCRPDSDAPISADYVRPSGASGLEMLTMSLSQVDRKVKVSLESMEGGIR